jgi:hypothetical protein
MRQRGHQRPARRPLTSPLRQTGPGLRSTTHPPWLYSSLAIVYRSSLSAQCGLLWSWTVRQRAGGYRRTAKRTREQAQHGRHAKWSLVRIESLISRTASLRCTHASFAGRSFVGLLVCWFVGVNGCRHPHTGYMVEAWAHSASGDCCCEKTKKWLQISSHGIHIVGHTID